MSGFALFGQLERPTLDPSKSKSTDGSSAHSPFSYKPSVVLPRERVAVASDPVVSEGLDGGLSVGGGDEDVGVAATDEALGDSAAYPVEQAVVEAADVEHAYPAVVDPQLVPRRRLHQLLHRPVPPAQRDEPRSWPPLDHFPRHHLLPRVHVLYHRRLSVDFFFFRNVSLVSAFAPSPTPFSRAGCYLPSSSGPW